MPAFNRAVASIPGRQRFGLTPFGTPIVVHASAGETGGTFGAWDTITPPGKGPAGHMHTRESELFRVIDSTYHFVCGADEFDAAPGTFVALPQHVPHKWWNIGDGTGLMMGMAAPGGCEQMFLDIAAAGSADQADIARIEARIGLINDETRALGFVEPTGPSMAPFPRAVVSFPDTARKIPNGRGGCRPPEPSAHGKAFPAPAPVRPGTPTPAKPRPSASSPAPSATGAATTISRAAQAPSFRCRRTSRTVGRISATPPATSSASPPRAASSATSSISSGATPPPSQRCSKSRPNSASSTSAWPPRSKPRTAASSSRGWRSCPAGP